MEGGLLSRLQIALPPLIVLACALVDATPLGLPHLSAISPNLAIIAVFYWSIWRPDLLPAWAVFLVGVVRDLLIGGPLGLSALLLLVLVGVCRSQRRIFMVASFPVGWWGFALLAGAMGVAEWLVVCVYYLRVLEPWSSMAQMGMNIAFYPALYWLFSRTEARALNPAAA